MAFTSWKTYGNGVTFKSQNDKVSFRLVNQARYERVGTTSKYKVQGRMVMLTTQTSASYYNSKANISFKINNITTANTTSTKPSSSSGWSTDYAQTIDGTKYVKGFCPGSGTWEVEVDTLKTRNVPLVGTYEMTKTEPYAPKKTKYTASSTLVLPATYAKPTLTIPTTMTIGTASTIKINQPTQSGVTYRYNVKWQYEYVEGNIATNTTSTSISWTPPEDMMEYMSQNSSSMFSIVVTTFANGFNIGDVTQSIKNVVIPEDLATPKILDTNIYGGKFLLDGVGIQNYTNLEVSCHVRIARGATASVTIEADGNTFTKDDAAEDTYVDTNFGIMQQAGKQIVKVTIRDSRGWIAVGETSYYCVPYDIPRITSHEVRRCDENGNLDDNGDYISLYLNAEIHSVNYDNVEYNTTRKVTMKYQEVDDSTKGGTVDYSARISTTPDENGNYVLNIESETYPSSADGFKFLSEKEYLFTFTIYDRFYNTPTIIEEVLYSGFNLIDFNHDGRSMSFGKVCNLPYGLDTVEMALNFDIQKGFTINGINWLKVATDDILKIKEVDLITGLTLDAKTNTTITNFSIPQISGYKPVFAFPSNTWGWQLHCWYCEVTSQTNLSWRAGNISDSKITNFTLRAIIVYVKDIT